MVRKGTSSDSQSLSSSQSSKKPKLRSKKKGRSKFVESDSDSDPSIQSTPPKKPRINDAECLDLDSFIAESQQGLFDSAPVSHESGSLGLIVSVELINFMCHKHLTVKFGPKMNFVIGQNGSGKSAILTALSVCLGAKASFTQRASSAKSLVKEGAAMAQVIVKLRNNPKDPFKIDEYGDFIYVERKIKVDASSSLALRDENKKIVSTKKDELIAIHEHFGLQMDNPMVILTQETAKKFLSSAKPSELYEFFMRGTQLEELSTNYQYILKKIEQMRNSVSKTKDAEFEKANEVKLLEVKIQDLQRRKSMYLELDLLEKQFVWATVEGKEKIASALQRECLEIEEEMAKLLERISAAESDTREDRSVNSNLSELKKELESKRLNLSYLDKDLVEKSSLISEISLQESEINSNVRNLRRSEQALAEKIESEKRRQNDSDAAFRNEREDKIQQLEAGMKEKKDEFQHIKELVDMKQQQISQIPEKSTKCKDMAKQLERELQRTKETLDRLTQSKKDNLLMFGPKMREILQEINATNFRMKPIGPLGMHVKLKDMRWSKTIDSIIGSLLNNFVVSNREDRDKLQRILDKYQANNSILLHSSWHDYIDVSSKEPSEAFLTPLRMLDIDENAVRSVLIVFTGLERVILVPERRDAHEVMRKNPVNVESAYTINAEKVRINDRGAISHFYMGRNANIAFFEDYDTQIQNNRNLLQQKQEQYQVIERDLNSFSSEQKYLEQEVASLKGQLDGLQEAILQINYEIRRLKTELQNLNTLNVTQLEHELEKEKEKLELLKGQFQICFNKKKELIAETDSLKISVTKEQEEIEELERKEEELLAADREGQLRRAGKEREIHRLQGEKNQLESKLKAKEAELADSMEEVEKYSSNARLICEKIPISMSLDEIEKKIQILQTKLKERGEDSKSPEEYMEQLEQRTAELAKIQHDLQSTNRLCDEMEQALNLRHEKWADFRTHISKRSNIHFGWSMDIRGYAGYLEYDHENHLLQVKIQSRESHKGGNTSTLSGGERSYGTISFLLSLWEAMSTPLLCLDEFDVFMDSVNRNEIIKMIMDFASKTDIQYILITPQSMNSVNLADANVIRLKDPERGQRTLD